ncbi:MAG: cytochrome b/b6 domain-containing protein [Nevskia sp.]|nr:cytochrome b/b6 domain-containing protein [Nevskia sp.]
MEDNKEQVRVWDSFVRIGHWTLAAAFLVAYFTAEDFEDAHIAAGYWVGAYVVARVIWGFIGSRYARFSDFVRGPVEVFGYLSSLFRGKPAHYLGHNPAGGAMIVALLVCLAATVVTGFVVQADSENEGPLAAWLGHAPAAGTTVPAVAAEGAKAKDAEGEAGEKEAESAYEELHGFFANLTLGLVVLHLAGVIAGSLIHRENLPRAMITGRKLRFPGKPGAMRGQGGDA